MPCYGIGMDSAGRINKFAHELSNHVRSHAVLSADFSLNYLFHQLFHANPSSSEDRAVVSAAIHWFIDHEGEGSVVGIQLRRLAVREQCADMSIQKAHFDFLYQSFVAHGASTICNEAAGVAKGMLAKAQGEQEARIAKESAKRLVSVADILGVKTEAIRALAESLKPKKADVRPAQPKPEKQPQTELEARLSERFRVTRSR